MKHFSSHVISQSLNLLISASLLLMVSSAWAAVGDGRAVYGQSGSPTNNPRDRAYTDASSPPFGAEGATNDTSATIQWVVTKADPQSDDVYVASFSNTADDTLYIQRYDGSAWNLDVSATDAHDRGATFRSYDLEIEQSSGDVLVVYENSGTANKTIAYYWYDPQISASWVGPCTYTYTSTANGLIEWVEMEPHPTGDEIALAMSDSNDDLIAVIWSGVNKSSDCADLNNNWTAVPALQLSTTLSASNVRKFDVAYEQSSGDVLAAYSIAGVAGVGYATKASGSTSWTDTDDDGAFADIGDVIDLGAEPGSDYIAIGTIGTSAKDLQLGIWNGSSWLNRSNNWDTATATVTAYWEMVGCGWVDHASNDPLAVCAYTDASASTLPYFTWNKTTASTTAWDQSANSPATFDYDAEAANGSTKNHIHVDQWPGQNEILVEFVDSLSDYWTLNFTGASTTTTWTTLDDTGSATNELENGTSSATTGPADMALVSFDPSPVAQVTNLIAQRDSDATQIVFDTQTESRVKGFHVARAELVNGQPGEFTRITKEIMPAAGSTVAGHAYQLTDTTAAAGHEYAYQLEVIGKGGERVAQTVGPIAPDLGGRLTRLDPVTEETTVSRNDAPVEPAPRVTRTGQHVRFKEGAEGLAQEEIQRHRVARVEHTAKAQHQALPAQRAPAPTVAAIKLHIREPGIYRVTGEQLANAGWNLSTIAPANLSLTAQDAPVPIRLVGTADLVLDPEDYVEFWGEPKVTRFYEQNVYWLSQTTAGGARVIERVAGKGGGTPLSYDAVVRDDGNEAYYADSPTEARWFVDYELWSPDQMDLTLSVDHVKFTGDRAVLKVGLQGMSTWGYEDPAYHHQEAVVYVNGERVGDYAWDGDVSVVAELNVPLKLLVEGENTITIEAPDGADGELLQMFLVDWLELTYPRAFVAHEDGLTFPGHRKGKVTYKVRQFPSEEALEYLVRDNGTVEFQTGFTVLREADGITIEAPDDGKSAEPKKDALPKRKTAARYVVIPPTAVKAIDALVLDNPSELRTGGVRSHLIIAPLAFHEALSDFVAHRRAQLVDVQDIYDEYSFGLPDPSAMREFLLSASTRDATTALLVGDGHFDYRDFQGSGVPAYIPVALAPSRYGEMPWDGWFATPDSELLPQLVIGRWPVRTVEELETVIAKTLAYETSGSEPRSAMLADNEPVFHATQDQLAERLRHPDEAIKIYHGEVDAATARQQFLDAVNGGVGVATYVGHGAIQLWSGRRLFTVESVELLTNAGRYPVLLALGCLSGNFSYPEDLDSIAERLLLAPDKGIVATLSPVGLTSTPEQQLFGLAWLTALRDGQTFGHALATAQQHAATQLPQSTAANLIHTFNLLGDPALQLR